MSKKEKLLEKLMARGIPKNFTTKDLDALMGCCNCEKYPGGRGSSISYYHKQTGRILRFDGPHPEKELHTYQVKLVRKFLKEINEFEEED